MTFLAAVGTIVGAQSAAAQSGSWGNTGAFYTDGILCQLNGEIVPLAAWTVNGSATAYATADISERGGVFQPAPVNGAAASIGAGRGGITGADVGAVAYLIQHHASGSPGVAETSVDVAAVAGGGSIQARCLGQGGTSAARAAAALSQARRYAGPYTVRAQASTPRPGQPADVSATVLSAQGNPTPGIDVAFTIGGSDTSATTGSDGTAHTPAQASSGATPVTATVTEPTSLSYFTTTPPSVALAAPTAARGTATLRPASPPHPVVSVSTPALVLASGTATPVASVHGTVGYPGTGTITVAGPVKPAAGKTCNSLASGDFTRAPQAWAGQFEFTGDGEQRAGETSALSPGCYSATASVEITDSTPSVHATSAFAEDATIAVSTTQIAAASAKQVVTPGTLSSTVTATNPGRASVSSSVAAYGPLPPRSGECAGLDWTNAAQAVTSDAVALNKSASTLVATIAVPPVSQLGCYTLAARSVVAQDGRTATVQESPGAAAATALVASPTLALVTSSYAGQQGKAMTGTVTVLGAYGFPGVIRIGLRAATTAPTNGCRGATFDPSPARGAPTSVAATGDGSYVFHTPVATQNRCYAITGTLALTANPLVRAEAPPPSDASVFLAGAQFRPTTFNDAQRPGGTDTARIAAAFGITGGLLLLLALWVMVRVYVSARAAGDVTRGWAWRHHRSGTAEGRRSPPHRPRPNPHLLP
ncbi:MAG: hypothetical protein ACR2LX_06795 [Jatrophihabitans sp.]